MNTIRIPTRYAKQLLRMTPEERTWIYDSMLSLALGNNVAQKDSAPGDILELIWRDAVMMENKNKKVDKSSIGQLSGSPALVLPGHPDSEGKGSEGKGSEVKIQEAGKPLKKSRTIKPFVPPSFDEVQIWIASCGHKLDADRIFRYYNDADWHDSKGNPVKNWKQKIRGVWCKDENKIKQKEDMTDSELLREYRLSPGDFGRKYGMKERIRVEDIISGE